MSVYDLTVDSASNAAVILPALLAAWFAAGRTVASEKTPEPTDLHKFRIEGKHLRYTMELFEPCYGPGLGRYLKLLKEAQNHLGEFQDCIAVSDLLLQRSGGSAPQKARAQTFLKRKGDRHYRAFQKFWTATVEPSERRWTAYLAHPSAKDPAVPPA